VKLGAAAGDDAGHAHLGGRVGRDPAPVLAQPLDLRRIAVGHDQLAARLPVGQLDQAPVGDARHRQAGQVCKRGLVVERRREDGAGLGQKRAAVPGGLGLAARAALDVVKAGPLQRLGTLLGQRGQEGLLVLAEGACLAVADPEHSDRPAVDDERQARQRAGRRRPDGFSQRRIAPALVDRIQEHRPGVAGGLGGRHLGVERDGGGAIGDPVGVADRAGQLEAAAVGAVQVDAGAQGAGGGHGVHGHHLEHLGLGARFRQSGGDRVQAHERVVGPLARRDVAGEAARVHDPPAAPEHVGVDQHVLDAAVPAHDARLVVAQRLAAAQARQEVPHLGRLGAELGHAAADVLVTRVADEVELGAVGPQDGPLRVEPLHPLGRVVDEVLQLLLALEHGVLGAAELDQRSAQRLLDLLALLDLGGQTPRAARGQPDLAAPRRGGARRLGGAADLVQRGRVAVAVPLLVEAAHHVRAQQRRPALAAQVVPHLLEADGRRLVALAPQEIRHLAVGAHARVAVAPAAEIDGAADHRLEQLPVGHVADHEAGQGLSRVGQPQLFGGAGEVDVDAFCTQGAAEGVAVLLGGEHDGRLAGLDPGGQVVGNQAAQEVVALAELDDVARLGQPDQKVGPDLPHARRQVAPAEVTFRPHRRSLDRRTQTIKLSYSAPMRIQRHPRELATRAWRRRTRAGGSSRSRTCPDPRVTGWWESCRQAGGR
jgi:hypothetical protein